MCNLAVSSLAPLPDATAFHVHINTVADPDKKLIGGSSDQWGHFKPKLDFFFFESFPLKYDKITLKFQKLSGGHFPTQLYLGPPLHKYLWSRF
jgi:hypothetical protein